MVFDLHLSGQSGPAAADRLLALCQGLSLGQHGALEAVLGLMATGGELHEGVVEAAAGRLQAATDAATQRTCVSLLAAIVPAMPGAVAAHLALVLHAARGGDAPTQQMACVCVRHVAKGGAVDFKERAGHATAQLVQGSLVAMVMDTPCPLEGWHAVAKEAIAALYALLPDPEPAAATLLDAVWRAGGDDGEGVDERALARACTVLGEVALQQLVCVY